MDSDVEELLRKFVQEGTEDRIERKTDRRLLTSMSNKLEYVVNAHGELATWTKLHEQKDDIRHEELKQAIAGTNSRVKALEDEQESTGRHNVEELQRQLKERDDNRTWWRRHATSFITGIIAALVTALVVGSCTYLWTREMPAPASAAHH